MEWKASSAVTWYRRISRNTIRNEGNGDQTRLPAGIRLCGHAGGKPRLLRRGDGLTCALTGATGLADDYITLDATALADLVRHRRVSLAELVEVAIARLERVEPKLAGMAEWTLDQARRAAREPLADAPLSRFHTWGSGTAP